MKKSAADHGNSRFCVVDMDKFQGDSRFTKNIKSMPSFDYYYLGNPIASYITANEKEIAANISSAERYVLGCMNSKNVGQNNMNGSGQMPQINPMQIQQQILNNAVSNPAYYQYLTSNPFALQQLVQKQIQSLQQMNQNQFMSSQMMPQANQQMNQQMNPLMMAQQMNQPQTNNFNQSLTGGLNQSLTSGLNQSLNGGLNQSLPRWS